MPDFASAPRRAPQDRRPVTAAQFVLAELRRMLLSGELAPGQPIRQDAIAEWLGVSRVPLREALKILEGEGLVVYRPQRGYVVSSLTLEDLVEIYRLRRILESEAARVAVRRGGEDLVAQLEAAADAVESAGRAADVLEIAEANRRFHFAIFDAAAMPHLSRLLTGLWDTTEPYRGVSYTSGKRRSRFEREHRKIIDAVRGRDSRQLVRELNIHRDEGIAALEQAITDLRRASDGATETAKRP